MTGDRGIHWGPLAWRLFIAFVLVALSSVAVLSTAALLGTGQGLAAASAADRQQTVRQVAEAAGSAYAEAGNWRNARLDTAVAVAAAAGAHLIVRDTGNTPVSGQGHGRGMPGMGASMNSGSQGGRIDAPVIVKGETVGSVQLAFGSSAASAAQDIAWEWIALATIVALLVALTASWFVSRRIAVPLVRLTTAAKVISAGDRSARAEVHAPGELGELGRAFNQMADEVTRAERARRNLTADVAHELRTPLSTLQAGLEELRDGLASPDAERLTRLHDQALRLGRIVEDLAELAAAESAALSLRLADIDLAALVWEVVAAHTAQLRAADVDIHTELRDGVFVRADPDRLHQALGNILSNAARYVRPDDQVIVRVHAADGDAIVEITDTGPGIPSDELAHVFDRLWRGRARRTLSGSGIGLAVVRELVAAHGGTVTATSGPRGGSTFTIRLPVHRLRPQNVV